MKRIIIAHKSHQLCNRLLVFSAFVAHAIEHGYKISNPGFQEYAQHFESVENSLGISYPETGIRYKRNILYRLYQQAYYLIVHFLAKLMFSRKISIAGIKSINDHYFGSFGVFLDQPQFQSLSAGLKCLLVFGYGFRDWTNMYKHAAEVRVFFRPNRRHQAEIDRFFADIQKRYSYEILVGVHIRRGDYKEFKDGKYYFEDTVYKEAMIQIRDLFYGKKVLFLLCSNEKVDLQAFSGLDVVLGPGHFIQDLYSLARCQYIIGPPSTYSYWAAFYGSVKLFHLADSGIRLKLNAFKLFTEIRC